MAIGSLVGILPCPHRKLEFRFFKKECIRLLCAAVTAGRDAKVCNGDFSGPVLCHVACKAKLEGTHGNRLIAFKDAGLSGVVRACISQKVQPRGNIAGNLVAVNGIKGRRRIYGSLAFRRKGQPGSCAQHAVNANRNVEGFAFNVFVKGIKVDECYAAIFCPLHLEKCHGGFGFHYLAYRNAKIVLGYAPSKGVTVGTVVSASCKNQDAWAGNVSSRRMECVGHDCLLKGGRCVFHHYVFSQLIGFTGLFIQDPCIMVNFFHL